MRKFILIALACVLAPAAAYSQTSCGGVELSWTPPTQNTDGTSLTNLAGYRIVYGNTAAELVRDVAISNPSISAYCLTGLTPATWYFAVRAFNTTGGESVNSNVASKVVTATPMPVLPAAPATLKITSGNLVVYQVLGTDGGFQFLPVGTVPANTSCIATQQVNGRYAVPTIAVTWYGNVKPKVVVAQCN